MLPIGAARAQTKSESSTILKRAIPASGEKLPGIRLGRWSVFDVDLTPDKQASLGEVLSLFVKHGGKRIDSSPMYGRAEGGIGELSTTVRVHEPPFLATKVWPPGKEAGIVHV